MPGQARFARLVQGSRATPDPAAYRSGDDQDHLRGHLAPYSSAYCPQSAGPRTPEARGAAVVSNCPLRGNRANVPWRGTKTGDGRVEAKVLAVDHFSAFQVGEHALLKYRDAGAQIVAVATAGTSGGNESHHAPMIRMSYRSPTGHGRGGRPNTAGRSGLTPSRRVGQAIKAGFVVESMGMQQGTILGFRHQLEGRGCRCSYHPCNIGLTLPTRPDCLVLSSCLRLICPSVARLPARQRG
jgi:hypothetical protein